MSEVLCEKRSGGAEPGVPSGLLIVDKPLGWSSMDVCRKVRWAVKRGMPESMGRRKIKVGHSGTLDPLATGVVVVCVGKATKQVDRLMGSTKVYEAEVNLSGFTASDDAEFEPEPVEVATPPARDMVESALALQMGVIEQVPPAFSAVHVDGKRAYKAARAGEAVEIKPRPVRIDAIEVLDYTWPTLRLRITCGKGTYIRSIARDLGKSLGTGGYLTGLRRTASGQFKVTDAVGVERFEAPVVQGDLMSVDVIEG
ncbi:MAG: tRNA pseudouridine(55) synthase TruB [Planctomycetota bacterium]